MRAGSEFYAAGPATVNELSARRVLIRRVDERIETVFVAATICYIMYTGRVPCHSKYRTSTRTVCTLYAWKPVNNGRCSSGAAWLYIQAGFEQTQRARSLKFAAFFYRDARMNLKLGGGRICAFTQCKKCQNFVLLLIPKQYHFKCKNNINIVLYLRFADIILGAFN